MEGVCWGGREQGLLGYSWKGTKRQAVRLLDSNRTVNFGYSLTHRSQKGAMRISKGLVYWRQNSKQGED